VMRRVIVAHPEAAPLQQETLAEWNCPFCLTPDNLLQFACGKRAEVIECRRKLLESTDHQLAKMMREIPPTAITPVQRVSLVGLNRAYLSVSGPAQSFRCPKYPIFKSAGCRDGVKAPAYRSHGASGKEAARSAIALRR